MRKKPVVPLISLDQVQPEHVRWLWPGRIPFGKITVLQGDPGLCKTTVALDVTARVSRNMPMPDGSTSDLAEPAAVLLMTAEDGLADTIRPRLDAMGSDHERIFAPNDQHYSIPRDTDAIRDAVIQKSARLIVLDPLAAFLDSSVNSWNNQHVRRALAPLAQIAQQTEAAVLVLDHLNKRSGVSAIQRGSGSIAFSAAARSVLLVSKHPEEPGMFVIAGVKSNLGPPPASLTYRAIEAENKAVRLEWCGECRYTADELLAVTFEPKGNRKLAEAIEFLRDRLADGPVSSKAVEHEAIERGISQRTLTRARKGLGVVCRPVGQRGEWTLSLHVGEVGASDSESLQSPPKPPDFATHDLADSENKPIPDVRTSGPNLGEADDYLFDAAVNLCRQKGHVSITEIVKSLRVSRAEAVHFVDEMERLGVVAPAQGSGPRPFIAPTSAEVGFSVSP